MDLFDSLALALKQVEDRCALLASLATAVPSDDGEVVDIGPLETLQRDLQGYKEQQEFITTQVSQARTQLDSVRGTVAAALDALLDRSTLAVTNTERRVLRSINRIEHRLNAMKDAGAARSAAAAAAAVTVVPPSPATPASTAASTTAASPASAASPPATPPVPEGTLSTRLALPASRSWADIVDEPPSPDAAPAAPRKPQRNGLSVITVTIPPGIVVSAFEVASLEEAHLPAHRGCLCVQKTTGEFCLSVNDHLVVGYPWRLIAGTHVGRLRDTHWCAKGKGPLPDRSKAEHYVPRYVPGLPRAPAGYMRQMPNFVRFVPAGTTGDSNVSKGWITPGTCLTFHLGSPETLLNDVKQMESGEVLLFSEFCMHLLICHTLLMGEAKRRGLRLPAQ